MKALLFVIALIGPVTASANQLRTRDVAPTAAAKLADFYNDARLSAEERMKLGQIVNEAINETSQNTCMQMRPMELVCEWSNIPFGLEKLSFNTPPVANEKAGLENIIAQVDKVVKERGLNITGRDVVNSSLAKYPLACGLQPRRQARSSSAFIAPGGNSASAQ